MPGIKLKNFGFRSLQLPILSPTENMLGSLAFMFFVQSLHSLILLGIMSDPFTGVTLHSFSSYRSPFSVHLCADVIYHLGCTMHLFLILIRDRSHTSFMYDSHNAKHMATNNYVTTNKTCNHTLKFLFKCQLSASCFLFIVFWC